jgi:exopolysaccharide biosynthesis WecB/TagA/CpsF family protein
MPLTDKFFSVWNGLRHVEYKFIGLNLGRFEFMYPFDFCLGLYGGDNKLYAMVEGYLWLSSFLVGQPLPETISGADFFTEYYLYHKDDPDCRIFLLGAKEGVAATAREKINAKVGREIVIGAHSPSFGFEKKPEEIDEIVDIVNRSGANVVLVGVGAPKQEKFIMRYKDRMPGVKVWMALGATIDFEAGNVKRAPRWVQRCALEWLYRIYCEPKRMFKRYICDDLIFFWYLFKQVLGIYKNPFEEATN